MSAAKPIRERDVVAYFKKRVKELGGEVRKVRWEGRRGAPDNRVMLPRTSLRGGGPLWVEFKAPGLLPEPHQLREHTRMRRLGERVEVVDSYPVADLVLGLSPRAREKAMRHVFGVDTGPEKLVLKSKGTK